MKAKVTIEIEGKPPLILEDFEVELTHERGIRYQYHEHFFIPDDIVYNGCERVLMCLWRGCPSFNSFRSEA